MRFITYALPLLILLLALFGFAVELLDAEPRPGSVIRLTLFEQPRVPAQLVLGAWLVEASGLLALFLLAQGRCGAWWLDGLVAGWLAWIFRGPLLVLTIVVAARQSHEPWWSLAFGWWVLYSVCGLALAWLARRTLSAPPSTVGGPTETASSPVEPVHPVEPPEPVEPIGPETSEQAPDLAATIDPDADPSREPSPDEVDPSDAATADEYETTIDEPPTDDVANDATDRDPADALDREDGRGET